MQLVKIIPFILMASSSSIVIASGNHSGDHGQASAGTNNAHWMAPVAAASMPNPVQADTHSIQKGAELFQQNCTSCHGPNADGNGMAGMMLDPPPANLQVMAGMHPDGDFAYKIKIGRGAMPSWKNTLNDQQIWHLVNFIQALNKQPVAGNNESSEQEHSGSHALGS